MAPIIRNFLYFLKRKFFLYFRKWKPPKNSLYFRKRNFFIFQEVTFQAPKNKKAHSEKTSYILGNVTFWLRASKNFLNFRRELAKPQKQTKNLLWRNFLSLVTFLSFLVVKDQLFLSLAFIIQMDLPFLKSKDLQWEKKVSPFL